ncbi:MAG TPA: HD domain-containing protein [Gemmatimonadales bacterium]|nr:HD domain-containing protein [Gemmatimonadales bacterium]
MLAEELEGVLMFLRAAERLKIVSRSAWTSDGQPESVAEHSWRLCLMAMLLYGQAPDVDLLRLLKMCVIHDLGEALGGDVPAPAQSEVPGKAAQERSDLIQLLEPLSPALRREILELWDAYEAAQTREAILAKGLDKLETILQHNQGRNPDDFDYRYNLSYGQRFTAKDPLLATIRSRLDLETERRAKEDPTSVK